MQYYTATTPLPSYIPYARFLLDMPLNETACLVYSLILSRIHLSQANGWVDTEGRVYCRYPIKALAADCHKSKTTIVTALADLEEQGLMTRRRGGAGYANMLYLKLPIFCTSERLETAPQKAGKGTPNNRKIKKPNYPDYDYQGDSL